MLCDVTLEDVIAELGKPTRQSGHQYYFQCPDCASAGRDNSRDNLLFNDAKGLLKCFACDTGAKSALRAINHRKGYKKDETRVYAHSSAQSVNVLPRWFEINRDNLINYLFQSIDELGLSAFRYLDGRGLTKQTIDDCGIGYDDNPSMVKMGPSVTFPMFSLNHNMELVGFELRQIEGGKNIKHTLDSPSCICAVYGKYNAPNIIICEGFIDAYSLTQLLGNKKDDFLICTGAHGVKSILPNIGGLDLSYFENCYLLLDNDDAGNTSTRQIIDNYPIFKDKRNLIKGCKDINEYLLLRG